MINLFERKRKTRLHKILSAFIAVTFIFSSIAPPATVYAQGAPAFLNLPAPGTMLPPSPGFMPVMVKGISVDPVNPLHFRFILDTGNSGLEGEELRAESNRLVKYFLASLTVPENELWVNLSPYEKDRMIPNSFGVTEMGRDLLAQDYILKQLTASLVYPEDDLGKEFWKRVKDKAYRMYGTTEIPMNTFNKVWIIPDKATVYSNNGSAIVVERHLKVMLEEDYHALQKNMGNEVHGLNQLKAGEAEVISGITSEIVREILIPEIEKEVNEGKSFAQLRQIYNSLILALWYKNNLKDTLLSHVYVNQNKISGIDVKDKQVKEKIYEQYLEAFKKGVYDYIKEDYDPATKEIVPRKYFSGGTDLGETQVRDLNDGAMSAATLGLVVDAATTEVGNELVADVILVEHTAEGRDSTQLAITEALERADDVAMSTALPAVVSLPEDERRARISEFRNRIDNWGPSSEDFDILLDIGRATNPGFISKTVEPRIAEFKAADTKAAWPLSISRRNAADVHAKMLIFWDVLDYIKAYAHVPEGSEADQWLEMVREELIDAGREQTGIIGGKGQLKGNDIFRVDEEEYERLDHDMVIVLGAKISAANAAFLVPVKEGRHRFEEHDRILRQYARSGNLYLAATSAATRKRRPELAEDAAMASDILLSAVPMIDNYTADARTTDDIIEEYGESGKIFYQQLFYSVLTQVSRTQKMLTVIADKGLESFLVGNERDYTPMEGVEGVEADFTLGQMSGKRRILGRQNKPDEEKVFQLELTWQGEKTGVITFKRTKDGQFAIRVIPKKTVLVYGYGTIASKIAKELSRLGFEIIAANRSPNQRAQFARDHGFRVVPLNEDGVRKYNDAGFDLLEFGTGAAVTADTYLKGNVDLPKIDLIVDGLDLKREVVVDENGIPILGGDGRALTRLTDELAESGAKLAKVTNSLIYKTEVFDKYRIPKLYQGSNDPEAIAGGYVVETGSLQVAGLDFSLFEDQEDLFIPSCNTTAQCSVVVALAAGEEIKEDSVVIDMITIRRQADPGQRKSGMHADGFAPILTGYHHAQDVLAFLDQEFEGIDLTENLKLTPRAAMMLRQLDIEEEVVVDRNGFPVAENGFIISRLPEDAEEKGYELVVVTEKLKRRVKDMMFETKATMGPQTKFHVGIGTISAEKHDGSLLKASELREMLRRSSRIAVIDTDGKGFEPEQVFDTLMNRIEEIHAFVVPVWVQQRNDGRIDIVILTPQESNVIPNDVSTALLATKVVAAEDLVVANEEVDVSMGLDRIKEGFERYLPVDAAMTTVISDLETGRPLRSIIRENDLSLARFTSATSFFVNNMGSNGIITDHKGEVLDVDRAIQMVEEENAIVLANEERNVALVIKPADGAMAAVSADMFSSVFTEDEITDLLMALRAKGILNDQDMVVGELPEMGVATTDEIIEQLGIDAEIGQWATFVLGVLNTQQLDFAMAASRDDESKDRIERPIVTRGAGDELVPSEPVVSKEHLRMLTRRPLASERKKAEEDDESDDAMTSGEFVPTEDMRDGNVLYQVRKIIRKLGAADDLAAIPVETTLGDYQIEDMDGFAAALSTEIGGEIQPSSIVSTTTVDELWTQSLIATGKDLAMTPDDGLKIPDVQSRSDLVFRLLKDSMLPTHFTVVIYDIDGHFRWARSYTRAYLVEVGLEAFLDELEIEIRARGEALKAKDDDGDNAMTAVRADMFASTFNAEEAGEILSSLRENGILDDENRVIGSLPNLAVDGVDEIADRFGLDDEFRRFAPYILGVLAGSQLDLAMTAVRHDRRLGDLREAYGDVITDEVLEAIDAIAHLNPRIKALRKKRSEEEKRLAELMKEIMRKREAGFYGAGENFDEERYLRDKREAQLQYKHGNEIIPGTKTKIRRRDARKANFIGSAIPEALEKQYSQLTGPLAGPSETTKEAAFVDSSEIRDRVHETEGIDSEKLFWDEKLIKKNLRFAAHALLSGAYGDMRDLEDAQGQRGTQSLDAQRTFKLIMNRDPIFMEVVREVMDEKKRAGKLRIGGKLMPQGKLTDDEFEEWKSQIDFTTQILRHRGPHLDDRHFVDENGDALAAWLVDIAIAFVHGYKPAQERYGAMFWYSPKMQTGDDAALLDDVFETLEVHMRKKDSTIIIGMNKPYVLFEQTQATFEAAEVRAALSQGGSQVDIVNLMKEKGEYSTDEAYEAALAEAQELDDARREKTGVDPKEIESRFIGGNTGRWDEINSVMHANAWDKDWISPNIEAITMDYDFMFNYEGHVLNVMNVPDLIGQTALAHGGMETLIPKGSKEVIAASMKGALAGGVRERDRGFRGKWIAHPDMAYEMNLLWEEIGEEGMAEIRANLPKPTYTQQEADSFRAIDPDPEKSPITIRGLRNLVSVAIQMSNAHLQGMQAAALKPADYFESKAVDEVEERRRKGDLKDAPEDEYLEEIVRAQAYDIESAKLRGDYDYDGGDDDYRRDLQAALDDAIRRRSEVYRMEDMATDEIRGSGIWTWVYKDARLTEPDEELGLEVGDLITADIVRRVMREELDKLLTAQEETPRNVWEAVKGTTLPMAARILERYAVKAAEEGVKYEWIIDFLNIALDLDAEYLDDPGAMFEEADRRFDAYEEAYQRDGTRLTHNMSFALADSAMASVADDLAALRKLVDDFEYEQILSEDVGLFQIIIRLQEALEASEGRFIPNLLIQEAIPIFHRINVPTSGDVKRLGGAYQAGKMEEIRRRAREIKEALENLVDQADIPVSRTDSAMTPKDIGESKVPNQPLSIRVEKKFDDSEIGITQTKVAFVIEGESPSVTAFINRPTSETANSVARLIRDRIVEREIDIQEGTGKLRFIPQEFHVVSPDAAMTATIKEVNIEDRRIQARTLSIIQRTEPGFPLVISAPSEEGFELTGRTQDEIFNFLSRHQGEEIEISSKVRSGLFLSDVGPTQIAHVLEGALDPNGGLTPINDISELLVLIPERSESEEITLIVDLDAIEPLSISDTGDGIESYRVIGTKIPKRVIGGPQEGGALGVELEAWRTGARETLLPNFQAGTVFLAPTMSEAIAAHRIQADAAEEPIYTSGWQASGAGQEQEAFERLLSQTETILDNLTRVHRRNGRLAELRDVDPTTPEALARFNFAMARSLRESAGAIADDDARLAERKGHFETAAGRLYDIAASLDAAMATVLKPDVALEDAEYAEVVTRLTQQRQEWEEEFGITFPWSVDEVAQTLGTPDTFQPDHVVSKRSSSKLRHMLAGAKEVARLIAESDGSEETVKAIMAEHGPVVHPTFGGDTSAQSIVMMAMWLTTIYISGWATSSQDPHDGRIGSDRAEYTRLTIPQRARKIVRALAYHDEKENFRRRKMTPEKRAETPRIDFFLPVIGDGDAGFGGPLEVMKFVEDMIEAGAAGAHWENQRPDCKNCGHEGGKVMISTYRMIQTLKAAGFAAERLGVPFVRVARSDAVAANLLDSDAHRIEQRFIRGTQNRDLNNFADVLRLIPQDSDSIARATLDWMEKADLMTFSETVIAQINRSKRTPSEKERLISQWQDWEKDWIANEHLADHIVGEKFGTTDYFTAAREQANSMGLRVYWDHNKPKTQEGFFRVQNGEALAAAQHLAWAPYADMHWTETDYPDLDEAKRIAKGILDVYPNQHIAYNTSASMNWADMSDDELREYIIELGKAGFDWTFITYALWHANSMSAYEFSKHFSEDHMLAFAALQRLEREAGVSFIKGNTFMGNDYGVTRLQTIAGGLSSTDAREGSTMGQFDETETAIGVTKGFISRVRTRLAGEQLDVRVLSEIIDETHIKLVAARSRLASLLTRDSVPGDRIDKVTEEIRELDILLAEAIDRTIPLPGSDQVAISLENASLDHMEERFASPQSAYTDLRRGLERDVFILRAGERAEGASAKRDRIQGLIARGEELLRDAAMAVDKRELTDRMVEALQIQDKKVKTGDWLSVGDLRRAIEGYSDDQGRTGIDALDGMEPADIYVLLFVSEEDSDAYKQRLAFVSMNEKQEDEGRDWAMTPLGGIDLNPALLDLQIKRDDRGIPLPIEQQPILKMNIDGFLPVIINIVPITNVPMLLGIADQIPVDPVEQADGSERDDNPMLSKKRFDIRELEILDLFSFNG